mgnify:CR=1 FL=1
MKTSRIRSLGAIMTVVLGMLIASTPTQGSCVVTGTSLLGYCDLVLNENESGETVASLECLSEGDAIEDPRCKLESND